MSVQKPSNPPALNTPWMLGSLRLENRVIQGPLAGYSCAPFRVLFTQYQAPAYCVSEMLSAQDVLYKHADQSRYLSRDANESLLAYQIAGTDPQIMAAAAKKLVQLGADIIDINCGCPKTKIRKKGAGSALLEKPLALSEIISAVRDAIQIPLTVKIRLTEPAQDYALAQAIAQQGADALIVHGRRWHDDYSIACDYAQIQRIKELVSIPVIANGDIADRQSLLTAQAATGCDAFMIARAGCGKPWLFKTLLENCPAEVDFSQTLVHFMEHIRALAALENEYKALLQARSLLRYYFRNQFADAQLSQFYQCQNLLDAAEFFNCLKRVSE